MSTQRDTVAIRAERQPRDPAAIQSMVTAREAGTLRSEWMTFATRHGYSYNFSWLGVPIIQHPEDIVIIQELIWKTEPDLVIETGIAHGGSLILSASILTLLGGDREVLGIDRDIRPHARSLLATHPLGRSITTIEGDSVSPAVADQVRRAALSHDKILVILDSNHTGDHVAAELAIYADLVSLESYVVVMDTVIQDLSPVLSGDRPWGPDDNPCTAVRQFLADDGRFVVDSEVGDRLLSTAAPGGYLLRVR